MENKIQLIKQSIAAAETSLKAVKQLLFELEGGKSFESSLAKGPMSNPINQDSVKEKPGVVGIFDGENMVSETGEKFPIPPNYVSKSMLVIGDTLKMIEEGGSQRFKQIEHVKRHRTEGILTKKDGKFRIVTPEGSYKLLPVSVEFFKASVGDAAVAYLPAGNLTAPYAALESVLKKGPDGEVPASKPVENVPHTQASAPFPQEQSSKQSGGNTSKPQKPKEQRNKNIKALPQQKEVKSEKIEEPRVVLTQNESPTNQVVEIKMPELSDDELR